MPILLLPLSHEGCMACNAGHASCMRPFREACPVMGPILLDPYNEGFQLVLLLSKRSLPLGHGGTM